MTRTPRALVVDDEPEVRGVLAALLRRQGFAVEEGQNGEDAVRLAAQLRPDVIFLDVMMPRKTGLQALAEIREADGRVPVVIVSASGEPEIAEEALRLGAVNFVQKPFDREEIGFVARRLRATLDEEADAEPVLELLESRTTALAVGNDLSLLARVVAFLGRELRFHYPFHDVPATEVKLALYEALANGIEHGNLEIGYDEKTRAVASPEGMAGFIERRRHEAPYRDRRVHLAASYGADEVVYRVRDEGPGFSRREHDARPRDVLALHGRGLLLIGHYMHRVAWSPSGNEIEMARRIPRRHAAPPAS